MKILQLCKKIPFPSKDGESIAVSNLSQSLFERGVVIDLLSFNTVKHYTDLNKNRIPQYYNCVFDIPLDNSPKIIPAVINLFSKQSYHISRYIKDEFSKKLVELLQKNDYNIIQIESLFLAPYIEVIRKNSQAKIVMRAHNLEYEIWENLISETTNPIKKLYLMIMTSRLKSFEIDCLKQYDLLVSISQTDHQKYLRIAPTLKSHCCPVGLDLEEYNSSNKLVRDLFFIGSLDWAPNVYGLKWFLEKVLPLVRNQYPDIQFHIAGRNVKDQLDYLNQDKNIIVHGEVLNAIDFMQDHGIMIVPLFSGSGIRVKILEGLALGKSIVTTSKGKEGIDFSDGDALICTDTVEAFANGIISYLENDELRLNYYQKGKSLIQTQFDRTTLVKRLIKEYETLI